MCQICCPRISLGLSCFCHKALARTGENWCISPSTMTTGRPPNTAVELPPGFFTALHCLSIESISVELPILTSSVISMVVSVHDVHNELTRREGPRLRRDPTATSKPVWIVLPWTWLAEFPVGASTRTSRSRSNNFIPSFTESIIHDLPVPPSPVTYSRN